MHVASVAIENWMRFAGKHRREFVPEVHGVVCRWAHDPARSNFGGKSALLEAIFQFALFGRHRFRTEDGWITKGQRQGSVNIDLVDGNRLIRIERSRKRGNATTLVVTIFDFDFDGTMHGDEVQLPVMAHGDEAQLAIEREIGLGFEDFSNSCYLGQKQMARFLSDRPGDRMDIVSGWFRLGALGRAADSVSEQLGKVLDEAASLEASRRGVGDAMRSVLADQGIGPEEDGQAALAAEIAALDEEVAGAKKTVALFEGQRDEHARTARDFEDAREYWRIVDEGKALRARIDGYAAEVLPDEVLVALREKLAGVQGKLGKASEQVGEKRTLVRGEFSGTCPVAGIACPAKDQINAQTQENAALLARVTEAFNELSRQRAVLASEIVAGEKLRQRHFEDSKERERLLAQALRLKPAADRVAGKTEVDAPTVDADLRTARDALAALEAERAALEAARGLIERQAALHAKAGEELATLRSRAELLSEARLALVGAEREIARQNLGEIEAGANRALAEMGIDLTVAVSWERETKQLAKHCDACGAAYPASQKVKSCPKCGAVRGPHLERKLEIAPSDHSGGSEDLAGISVQLAAAAWLRRDRGAAWAVAVLDEPFSALDQAHAHALAGHLPRILKGYGFSQAFVCAHSQRIMAGMPAVVEIEAGPEGSRIVGGEDGDNQVRAGIADGDRRDARTADEEHRDSELASIRRRGDARGGQEDGDRGALHLPAELDVGGDRARGRRPGGRAKAPGQDTRRHRS